MSFDAANIGIFSICNVFTTFFQKHKKKTAQPLTSLSAVMIVKPSVFENVSCIRCFSATLPASLLGSHDELTSVVQVDIHVVSTVHDMHGAGGGIDGHVRGFSLVMCSSLSASGMRLSSFRMCHFTFTLIS